MAENRNDAHRPVRIPPLPRSEWGDEEAAAIRVLPAEMTPPPGAEINALNLMAHHPALSEAVLRFSLYLRFEATLDDRQRELLVLRTVWLHRAEPELRRHARLARRYGFTEDELVAVAVGSEAPEWSPAEALLLRVAEELHDDYYVGDATWRDLQAHFTRRQIMDALFVVGAYTMMAMAYGSMGLQPDNDVQPFPVEFGADPRI